MSGKTKVARRGRPPKVSGTPVPALSVELVQVAQNALPAEVGVNPNALIQRAIDSGNLDALERILAMRRELQAEWAKKRFHEDLAAFQSACPDIKKTKVVRSKDGTERYRYAPLASIVRQVKGFLQQYGFSYQVKPDPVIADNKVIIMMDIHHRDGHSETVRVPLPMAPADYMNNVQAMGSTITYGSRYVFCAGFGIMLADEDDDGRGGNPNPQPSQDMTSVLKDSIEYQDIQTAMNQMFADAKQYGFWQPKPPNRVSDEQKAAHKEWAMVATIEQARVVYLKYKQAFDAKMSERPVTPAWTPESEPQTTRQPGQD